MRTPLGRKMRGHVRGEGGAACSACKRSDLDEAGVHRTEEKVTEVKDGKPVLGDGRALNVANVIWCTGFNKDVSWIQIPVTGEDGWPEQERGVVSSSPGLYFLGLPLQYAFASMLVGGAGRDAKYVANHIGAAMRAAARKGYWHRTAGRPGHWVSSDEGARGTRLLPVFDQFRGPRWRPRLVAQTDPATQPRAPINPSA